MSDRILGELLNSTVSKSSIRKNPHSLSKDQNLAIKDLASDPLLRAKIRNAQRESDSQSNVMIGPKIQQTTSQIADKVNNAMIMPLSYDADVEVNDDGSFDWKDKPYESYGPDINTTQPPETAQPNENTTVSSDEVSLMDGDDYQVHVGADTKNGPKGVVLDVYKPVEIDGQSVEVVGLLSKGKEFYSYDDVMQAAAKQAFADNFGGVKLDDEIMDELFSTEFESTSNGVDYTNYDAFTNDTSGASHIGGFNAGFTDFWIDRYERLYPGFKNAYENTCSDLVLCDNYLHQTADERAAVPMTVKSDIVELISDSVNDLSRMNDYGMNLSHDHSDMNPIVVSDFDPLTAGTSSAVEGITTGSYLMDDGKFNTYNLLSDALSGAAYATVLSTIGVDVDDKKELINALVESGTLSDVLDDAMREPTTSRFVAAAMNNYGLKPYIEELTNNATNPQALMDIVRDPKFLESLSETIDYVLESPFVSDTINKACDDPELLNAIENTVNDFGDAKELSNDSEIVDDAPEAPKNTDRGSVTNTNASHKIVYEAHDVSESGLKDDATMPGARKEDHISDVDTDMIDIPVKDTQIDVSSVSENSIPDMEIGFL